LLVRESQHDIIAIHKPCVARAITSHTFLKVMRSAVDFDNEPHCRANEINYICAHRRLAAELQFIEMPRLKVSPQQHLGACHLATKRLSSVAPFFANC